MRFDWQQLSPGERQVLLRHFLLKAKPASAVTVEKVCAAMQKTHYLSCYTDANGKAVIQFVTTRKGVRSGVSTAEDLTEGIFKAALRAKGVDLDDGAATMAFNARRRTARLVHA